MNIEKKVETTFTLSGIPEETLVLIIKAITMATGIRRVGTIRLSISEIRILRNVASEIAANQIVAKRPAIEDEEEPEEDELSEDEREYDRAR